MTSGEYLDARCRALIAQGDEHLRLTYEHALVPCVGCQFCTPIPLARCASCGMYGGEHEWVCCEAPPPPPAFAPKDVSFHFRRDERGQPLVVVFGMMGTGTDYRWGHLTPTGWVELARNVAGAPTPDEAWFVFEHMTQRLDADEYYAPIVAPEVVSDGPPRRTA